MKGNNSIEATTSKAYDNLYRRERELFAKIHWKLQNTNHRWNYELKIQ